MKSYDDNDIQRVRELYESGYTYKEICKELYLSIGVVTNIIHELHQRGMKKKRSSLDSDYSVERSRKAHELVKQGMLVSEALKVTGCTHSAYYDWKSGYCFDGRKRKRGIK